jgi:hypothetical protein
VVPSFLDAAGKGVVDIVESLFSTSSRGLVLPTPVVPTPVVSTPVVSGPLILAPLTSAHAATANSILARMRTLPLSTKPPGAPQTVLPRGATRPTKELVYQVTPDIAAKSLIWLATGVSRTGGPAVPPVTTNTKGCWLSKRSLVQSYIRMTPITSDQPRLRTEDNYSGTEHRQRAHRLAIRAWGSWTDFRLLVEEDYEASYLCHTRNCF